MTPLQLASVFTILDTHGVQDILRIQSTVNPLKPDEHITAVWVRPEDWACVYDSLTYEADEPPMVRASMAGSGTELTLVIDAEGYRVFCWWPLKDLAHVADQLQAAGVNERHLEAWRVMGGAL